MNKIELLAPVGSHEAFISALNNGADAVYLAGEHFGAREKATFTNDEIKEMIEYAHIREVRVHVVINTLIYDDEMDRVMEFVDFLYNADVDAIIVQDLGVITRVSNEYPDLEIHASTQLNTLTVESARTLKKLGVTRVILARETPLEEAIKIKKEVGIDVEVFAHGALCMGYSGQCLFSSLTMKKSGNRGECLQLCRLPYDLIKNGEKINTEKYLLSCKDLCTIHDIDKLIDAGITSLKIEGRVKSDTYVGKVVSTYRKYIDQYYQNKEISVEKNDVENLKKVFNREFTKGYIFNEKSRDIVNAYRPNNIGVKLGEVVGVNKNKVSVKLQDDIHQGDGIRIVTKGEDVGLFANKIYKKGLLVNGALKGEIISLDVYGNVNVKDAVYKTSDVVLNDEIKELNKIVIKRFDIDVKVEAYCYKPLKIIASDNRGNSIEVESEFIVDVANKTPTSKERIKEQISKLNDSVYSLKNFEVSGDEMIIIPISVINKLRNEMIEKLNEKRKVNHVRLGKKELNLPEIKIEKEEFSYMYKANNREQYDVISSYVSPEFIYFNNKESVYAYPRISNGVIKPQNNSVLVNELSDINEEKNMIANTYLNTTNIYSLYCLYSLGFKRVTLSVEMTKERIENMIFNYKKVFGCMPNLEVIVYGKIDLMITKHCIMNKHLSNRDIGCGECSGNTYYLLDRKGYKLEMINDGLCNIRILNPKKLHLVDEVNYLRTIGISKLRLEFTTENKRDVMEVVDGYNNESLELLGVTNGYY